MENAIKVEDRLEQPYLAIRSQVTMPEIPAKLPPLIPEIIRWLESRGIEAAGPVFFNYLEMEKGQMTVDVGIPVKVKQTGDERVQAGSFPAGRYVIYTHLGNYSELPEVHQMLDEWSRKSNLRLKGPCVEFYPTDPAIEPNPANWQTDIMRQISLEAENAEPKNLSK